MLTSGRISILFFVLSVTIMTLIFLRSSEPYEAREGIAASILTRQMNDDGSDYNRLETHYHAQLQTDGTWGIITVDDGVLNSDEIKFLNTVYGNKSDREKLKEYSSGSKPYPSYDIIKDLITTPLDEIKSQYYTTRDEMKNDREQLDIAERDHINYVSTIRDKINDYASTNRDKISDTEVEANSLRGQLEALKSDYQIQQENAGREGFFGELLDQTYKGGDTGDESRGVQFLESLPTPPPEVKEFSTPMFPPKGSRLGYRVGELTGFDVDCENGELTGFEFNLDGYSGKYDYTCNDIESSPGVAKNTDFKYAGGGTGNITALSNHTVDCENKAISQFKLNTAPGSGWSRPKDFKYDYKCSSRETSGRCREDIMTPGKLYTDNGRWAGVSGIHPKCNDNEVLTKFKYVNDGEHKYQYTCCEVSDS